MNPVPEDFSTPSTHEKTEYKAFIQDPQMIDPEQPSQDPNKKLWDLLRLLSL